MPIINAYKSKQIIVMKRGMGSKYPSSMHCVYQTDSVQVATPTFPIPCSSHRTRKCCLAMQRRAVMLSRLRWMLESRSLSEHVDLRF